MRGLRASLRSRTEFHNHRRRRRRRRLLLSVLHPPDGGRGPRRGRYRCSLLRPLARSTHVLIYRRRNWHFPFGRLTAHARTLRFRDIRQRFPVESRKHSADFTVEKRCGLENLAQIRSRGPNTLPTTEARRCASVNVEFIRTTQTDRQTDGAQRTTALWKKEA